MRKSKKQVRRTYSPPLYYGRFSLPKISAFLAPSGKAYRLCPRGRAASLFKFHPPQINREQRGFVDKNIPTSSAFICVYRARRSRSGRPILPILALVAMLCLSQCDNGGGGGNGGGGPESPILSANIALWNAGSFQGNFGFNRCQDQLDSTGGTSDGERIGQALKRLSFNKAVFFGSTGGSGLSDYYRFLDLDTDEDALGMQSGAYTYSTSAEDENIALASLPGGSVSYTESFGGSALSLSELVNVDEGGAWQNGGENFIDTAGISSAKPAWSFGFNGRRNESCR